MNYYNENDAKAAAWLRELINQGHIPNGEVDTRSIKDVSPTDLLGFTQCHFFAGIGGWSYALQLAGWPASEPVGTGSCPCQPFSTAGKGLAQKDDRHLWPVFFQLIRDCRNLGQPWAFTVLGEQVASAIGKGWLDGISADLEAEGYTVGAAVLGAHSVNAPHIRQRLYWMANATGDVGPKHEREPRESTRREACPHNSAERGKHHEWVARDSDTAGSAGSSSCSGVGDAECDGLRVSGRTTADQSDQPGNRQIFGLGQSNGNGCQSGSDAAKAAGYGDPSLSTSGWHDSQFIACRDGKTRRIPTEPAFFPLANGVPSRVVQLRGFGNAIVPQVAAVFIQAAKSCLDS